MKVTLHSKNSTTINCEKYWKVFVLSTGSPIRLFILPFQIEVQITSEKTKSSSFLLSSLFGLFWLVGRTLPLVIGLGLGTASCQSTKGVAYRNNSFTVYRKLADASSELAITNPLIFCFIWSHRNYLFCWVSLI